MSLAGLVADLLARPDVGRRLAVGALVAARIAPLALVAPVLGLRSAPATIRAGVVVAFTVALTPLALGGAEVPAGALFWGAMLREALIGALFGLVASIPFFALESGGRLVDLYRGANLAEVIAPPTGERTSPTGDLAILGGLACFAAVGGLRLTVGAFASSLVDVPVGASSLDRSSMLEAAHALTHAMRFATVVAAPAAVAILVADVAIGLLARSVPRISVFFVAMPIRAMLGLLLAFGAIGIVLRESTGLAGESLRLASRLLG